MLSARHLFAAVAALLICGGSAFASSVTTIDLGADLANRNEGVGDFTGSLSYDNGTHLLTISLKNTSPIANGGYLVGLAFNIDDDPGDLSFTPVSIAPYTLFEMVEDSGAGNSPTKAQPFGTYEYALALRGDWGNAGSGSPNEGIGVGDTGTFTFTLNSINDDAALDGLTASSFFTTAANGDTTDYAIAARFMGFNNGKSDKVPTLLVPPTPPVVSVPVPSAVYTGLALMGLLAGGAVLRYRRKAGTPF